MDSAAILTSVEQTITTQKEREYFWIHQERYRIILEEIIAIAGARGGAQFAAMNVPPGSQQNEVRLPSERNQQYGEKIASSRLRR